MLPKKATFFKDLVVRALLCLIPFGVGCSTLIGLEDVPPASEVLGGTGGQGGSAGGSSGTAGLDANGTGMGGASGSSSVFPGDASLNGDATTFEGSNERGPVDSSGPTADSREDSATNSRNGTVCIFSGDCASRNCVEGVCCDMPCTASCTSCLAANTGRVNGTCRPSTAGTDPHNDCTADPMSTCGNDGSCDGNGGCRKYGTSVVCQVESCINNDPIRATYTPASQCNGIGACVPTGITSGCGNFLCGSGTSRCAMTCQASSECVSGAYCANHNCATKKPLGAVCSTIDECTSSICGGRCCAAPCTCPQPSAQNLFQNAGFDSDLTGWGTTGVQWSSMDADGCPYSGSANILSGNGNPSTCVAVTPGASYNFGGWFRNLDGNLYTSYFFMDTGPGCTGTSPATIPVPAISGTETVWTYKSVSIQIPADVVSLKLFCDASANTYVDKLFLSAGGY